MPIFEWWIVREVTLGVPRAGCKISDGGFGIRLGPLPSAPWPGSGSSVPGFSNRDDAEGVFPGHAPGTRLQIDHVTGPVHEYPGTYATLSADTIRFEFADNHGHGIATGTFDGVCLVVDFNPWMELSDFEDGIYCPPAAPFFQGRH